MRRCGRVGAWVIEYSGPKHIHPYLTSQVPGIGGTIKESAEDFQVEEIPSYLPCGSGEHCYLTIEKAASLL